MDLMLETDVRQSAAHLPLRRRRQLRACDACHRRKVRCDAVGRQPCSNCRAAGAACRFDIVQALARRSKPRRSERTEPPLPPIVSAEDGPTLEQQPPSLVERPVTWTPQSQPADSDDTASECATNQRLVEHGLVDFFQHGISSQSWSFFDGPDEARMCYVGIPLSNLAFLVSQERGGDNVNLHFPIPRVHRILPWKPNTESFPIQLRSSAGSKVSSLPAEEVRDALVEAFFQEIHPGFPVVDESEFRQRYVQHEAPPPLLLLQSILLAGAHVCQHPKITQSRTLIKAALFQRAKTLWDLRFENDRVTLVQAALLFSWHLENADTVSANSYYWISVACGIAFGLGMHRDLTASSTTVMPQSARNLFRRIWWTLFQASVLSALDHGRPLLSRNDDMDQPALTVEDLVETDGSMNQRIHLQYCIHNSKLCVIIADILDHFSPGSIRQAGVLTDTSHLDARLADWLMDLPPGDDFYMLQLRLHHNMALLHLHRAVIQHNPGSVPPQSPKLCSGAAESLVGTLRTIFYTGAIRRCYFTGLTALMGAAIHFAQDLRLAMEQNSKLLALQAQTQLEGCFPIWREMALYWPTASAATKLFQHILDGAKSRMPTQSMVDEGDGQAMNLVDHELLPENWEYIFSTLFPGDTQPDWSHLEGTVEI